jgi:chemosensory pili system protein ChpA (sensor histidine kinase/response regulator)
VKDDDSSPTSAPNGAGSHQASTAALILVVDDDPDVLGSLTDALASEGYEVRGARDGIEALEAISEQRPDLIITDLLMPTMTGFELLAALHDSPELATIPTLIITAGRSPEARRMASDSVILPKPLDLDRLLRAISAYTSPPRARN